jgi:hypothetical protein
MEVALVDPVAAIKLSGSGTAGAAAGPMEIGK